MQATPDSPGLTQQQLQQVFALYSAGQFSQALASAEELARSYTGEPALLNLTGAIHLAMGQPGAAVGVFRQAVELRPDVAIGHLSLGNALLETGDPAGALACFSMVRSLQPENLQGLSRYCQCLERLGRLYEL